ncbi:MAG TPA: AAA family ATPase, partial [Longimicrobiales bacterium]|nr:AAA family ATPase [Longimicrobiales bacterium]
AEPLEAEPLRRLVRALTLAGHRAEAEAELAAFSARVASDPALEAAHDLDALREELGTQATDRAAPGVASAAVFTPALVGRDEPLRRLGDAWRAARDGGAATVVVEGAEGLGKTRVVEEMLRRVRHECPGALVLQTAAWPEENPGEWGVARDLLAGLAGAAGLGGAPEDVLAEVGQLVPAIRDRFRHLPPAGGDPGALPAALLRVLSDVAAEQPVVLALDDVAGSDPATRELLLYLAHRLPPSVLLLLTLDPREVVPGSALAALCRLPTTVRVPLGQLDRGDVEEIVASMLPLAPEQRALLADSLHAWAEGNPFYTTQLVSALADRGVLGTDGPAAPAELAGDPGLPLPDRVREAVLDRLARLSEDARAALEAAAVLDHGADPELIAATAGLPLGPRLTVALDELIARRFLRPPDAGREGYLVAHAMLRRTLLELMGPARRQALHGAAAAALQRPPRNGRAGGALVAHHVARAGRFAPPRAHRLAARWAVLALVTVLLGGTALGITLTGDGGAAASPEADRRVAVLPFSLREPDPPPYLREGMVDLLSARLDGPGGLRAVAPQTVLGLGGPYGPGGPDLEEARAVARSAQAGFFVLGSVLPGARGLGLQATLHDQRGDRVATAEVRVPLEDSLPRAVDELARQLLTGWAEAAGEQAAALAAPTTRSLPALKSYLEGERHLRAGRFMAALTSFRRAVAHDSTFALGYYRMTVAAEWIPVELGADTLARALELSHLLPRRSRLLIEGVAAARRGAFQQAWAVFHAGIQGYPEDREINLQMDEMYFHSGPLRPEPKGRWLDTFRALERAGPPDPTIRLHRTRIGAAEGDTAYVLQLTDGLDVDSTTTDRRLIEMAALRLVVGGREPSPAGFLDALVRTSAAHAILVGATIYGRDYGALAELVRAAADTPEGTPALYPHPHILLAQLEAARGRWRAAWREVDLLASVHEETWVTTGATLALTPGAVLPPGRLAALRAALRAWHPHRETGGPTGNFGHGEVSPEVWEYLLGGLALLAGEPAETERRAAALEEAAALLRRQPEAGPHAPRLVHDMALELRARLHLAAGRPDEAADAFRGRTEDLLPPQEKVRISSLYARAQQRFLQGTVTAATGERANPLQYFESVGLVSPWEAPLVAAALIESATIYEQLGERARAARLYLRAAEIWRDADPEVRVR